MNRRRTRPQVERSELPADNPWLMRVVFLLIPLLFLGAWWLTFHTLAIGGRAAVGATATVPAIATRRAVAAPARSTASIATATPAPATHPTASVVAFPTLGAAVPGLSPTPAPSPTAASATYVVKAGDTLGAIAQAHRVTVAAIAHANNLSPPYPLKIGQHLIIPGS